jgi:hypothetical protein
MTDAFSVGPALLAPEAGAPKPKPEADRRRAPNERPQFDRDLAEREAAERGAGAVVAAQPAPVATSIGLGWWLGGGTTPASPGAGATAVAATGPSSAAITSAGLGVEVDPTKTRPTPIGESVPRGPSPATPPEPWVDLATLLSFESDGAPAEVLPADPRGDEVAAATAEAGAPPPPDVAAAPTPADRGDAPNGLSSPFAAKTSPTNATTPDAASTAGSPGAAPEPERRDVDLTGLGVASGPTERPTGPASAAATARDLPSPSEFEVPELPVGPASDTVRVEIDSDLAVEVRLDQGDVDVALIGTDAVHGVDRAAESDLRDALRRGGYQLGTFERRDEHDGQRRRRPPEPEDDTPRPRRPKRIFQLP